MLWAVEASVYLAVARAVDLGISAPGALYLVALTNFVAALPAAPGLRSAPSTRRWSSASRRRGTGSAAVSYLLLLRFVLYVPITVVGFVVLVTRYGGWSRLRARGSSAPAEASRAAEPARCGRPPHSLHRLAPRRAPTA